MQHMQEQFSWDAINQTVEGMLKSSAMLSIVQTLDSTLDAWGVPEPHPTAEQVLLSIAACVGTLMLYFVFFGNRHRQRRLRLQKDLNEAKDRVRELEMRLVHLEMTSDDDSDDEKQIRIWMDGAFDIMHYGHMNAFRQGKALGTYLIVGVNSDDTITQCKGAPVMNDQERITAVSGCKFVDEVVPGVPYIMNEEYLKYVIEKYDIDYVVHGDDPCIVDGKDVYEAAQRLGKYRTIPRTEGVSTTDIVGRMLLMTRSHHSASFGASEKGQLASGGSFERRSNFLTTSHIIRLFSAGVRAPSSRSKIVYIDGSWDMFHAGHVSLLKEARKYGDYVIGGVFNDSLVNELEGGGNLPIMNLHERVLSLLGCKYVDDVLIDAPSVITAEMIKSLNISVVLRLPDNKKNLETRYQVPMEQGIYHELSPVADLTVGAIIERIHQHNERFMAKFEKKKKAEDEYYANRYQLPEGGKKQSAK